MSEFWLAVICWLFGCGVGGLVVSLQLNERMNDVIDATNRIKKVYDNAIETRDKYIQGLQETVEVMTRYIEALEREKGARDGNSK